MLFNIVEQLTDKVQVSCVLLTEPLCSPTSSGSAEGTGLVLLLPADGEAELLGDTLVEGLGLPPVCVLPFFASGAELASAVSEGVSVLYEAEGADTVGDGSFVTAAAAAVSEPAFFE